MSAPPVPPAAPERLALAADLQDLVAHRVTAMEVQTAAARRLVEHAPGAAGEALMAVLRLAREAMDELKRLGRLLDDGGPVAMHPAPTLANLEALTGEVLDTGEVVVPGGVALCAFRAVEVLTRAGDGRHGVSVRLLGDTVRIEAAWAPGPEDEERLQTAARPCGGRVVRRGRGWCRVELPLLP